MKESDISRAIQIECAKHGWRLFRQNVGRAWAGEVVARTPSTITLYNPRPLRAGLCEGSSDLIGWVSGTRRGHTFGLFIAVEVKTPRGRLSSEQVNFLDQVNKSGGIGIVARSPEEAVQKIRDAIDKIVV